MQSLGVDNLKERAAAETIGARALRGVVLPRFLRRPARALEQIEWRMPRHIGIKGFVALFVGTAIAGTLIGGHGMTVVAAVTAWSGLAIDEVRISGQSEASEVDVLERLALGPFPSLLAFDVEAAKARVELLPWVRQATLKKLFPNTLEVAIGERVPFAIWQRGGEISLIDADGMVITDQVGERYAGLRFVVGRGAAERAGAFNALIGAFPGLARRTRAGVLISERRWTVVLDDGIELMLPESDPAAALAKVARLDVESALLSREIAAVDLRTADRVIIRLNEQGAEARKALLAERANAARRGRTNT